MKRYVLRQGQRLFSQPGSGKGIMRRFFGFCFLACFVPQSVFAVCVFLFSSACLARSPDAEGAASGLGPHVRGDIGLGQSRQNEAPPDQGEGAWIFGARREFRGAVRRDMAERVAATAAELAAYEQAGRLLAGESDMRFVAGSEGGNDTAPLEGLARMVFGTRLVAVQAQGFPPFLCAVGTVALERPEAFRQRLTEALADADGMEFHRQMAAREKELVARYDALAPNLLSLQSPDEGGGERLLALQAITNELAGIKLYIGFVNGRDDCADDPAAARARLERAEALAPRNPFILNALAEVWLRLDRPLAALEYSRRALAEAPEYSRAHDTRGAILLRQRLPLMAAQAFGKAIELAPRNASYYLNRAAAYLVLEEIDAMCRDFQSACTLGECEGLAWALEEHRCNKAGP